MSYVPLGIRTEYSFFDGLCRVPSLVERARAMRFGAIGVADLHSTLALPRLQLAAREAGLRAILGARVRLLPELPVQLSRGHVQPEIQLLATDARGLRNLFRLVSLAHLERGDDESGLTLADLENSETGLLAIDGGGDGPVCRAFLQENPAAAIRIAGRLRAIFGAENFFMQVQRHGETDELGLEPFILHLARKLNVAVVAVNDTRYLDAEEARQYEVVRCHAAGRTLADPARPGLRPRQHLRSQVEMQHLFRDLPEALANTCVIAERCQATLELGLTRPPQVPIGSGRHPDLELRLRSERGACRSFGTERYQDLPVIVRDRIAHELAILEEKKLASCFLLVQDVTRHAREEGIPAGPGRGSLTGSLVAHVLGITALDPLAHGLIFERFISPAQHGLPGFDLEFAHVQRETVLQTLRQRVGRECVAQLGVVERLTARAAANLAATVLGVSGETKEALAQEIHAAGEKSAVRRRTSTLWDNPRLRAVLEIASRLEGMPQRLVGSPSGLLIGSSPLTDEVALERGPAGILIAQATQEDAELLGFMRLHLQGSRHTSVQALAIRLVGDRSGRKVELETGHLDDESTYRGITSGRTQGVPYLEGARCQAALRQVQPARFTDLVAFIAATRPWTWAEGGAERLAQFDKVGGGTPAHLEIARILAPTQGQWLFEEQLLQTVSALAGYDLAHAEQLRLAIVSRRWGEVAKHRQRFLSDCVERGTALAAAEGFFARLLALAGILTCQADATARAQVAYRSAYLAVHHPLEFFAALLHYSVGQGERNDALLREAVERQVRLLDVDINCSDCSSVIEGDAIRLGFTLVRHVGEGLAERIMRVRHHSGPYRSLTDFRTRLHDLPRRALAALIEAGAFASLGIERGHARSMQDESRQSRRLAADATQLVFPFQVRGGSVSRGGGSGGDRAAVGSPSTAERREAGRAAGKRRAGVQGTASPRLWVVGRIRSRVSASQP